MRDTSARAGEGGLVERRAQRQTSTGSLNRCGMYACEADHIGRLARSDGALTLLATLLATLRESRDRAWAALLMAEKFVSHLRIKES